jgi:RNA-splicing ligase RtcB
VHNVNRMTHNSDPQAKDIFIRGLADLPDEMLREGARAQYATCELARHRVALATWELEENIRWGSFLTHTLSHLRLKHQYSERDLGIWEQTCTNRGLQDLREDRLFHEYTATQETLTLAVLQEQARQLKQYVEERGVDNDEAEGEGEDFDGSDHVSSKYDSPTP